jgi:hypothetical protein
MPGICGNLKPTPAKGESVAVSETVSENLGRFVSSLTRPLQTDTLGLIGRAYALPMFGGTPARRAYGDLSRSDRRTGTSRRLYFQVDRGILARVPVPIRVLPHKPRRMRDLACTLQLKFAQKAVSNLDSARPNSEKTDRAQDGIFKRKASPLQSSR